MSKVIKIFKEDILKNNKLDMENKCFQNMVKMICYRGETFFANLLSPGYKKSIHEK